MGWSVAQRWCNPLLTDWLQVRILSLQFKTYELIFIMIINVLFSILGLTFANWVYAHVAYNKYFQERPFTAYAVSILAAAITTAAWVLLIRNVKATKDVFITNLIWDVGATILCVTLPIIMFNVKLDMKTAIGCVIAIVGIIITKA